MGLIFAALAIVFYDNLCSPKIAEISERDDIAKMKSDVERKTVGQTIRLTLTHFMKTVGAPNNVTAGFYFPFQMVALLN